jgi:hypothetical protein
MIARETQHPPAKHNNNNNNHWSLIHCSLLLPLPGLKTSVIWSRLSSSAQLAQHTVSTMGFTSIALLFVASTETSSAKDLKRIRTALEIPDFLSSTPSAGSPSSSSIRVHGDSSTELESHSDSHTGTHHDPRSRAKAKEPTRPLSSAVVPVPRSMSFPSISEQRWVPWLRGERRSLLVLRRYADGSGSGSGNDNAAPVKHRLRFPSEPRFFPRCLLLQCLPLRGFTSTNTVAYLNEPMDGGWCSGEVRQRW